MIALAELDQELRRIGSAYSGTWTYALTDIASGEQIGCGQDDVMPTASLIKVPILVSLYQAVEEGKLRSRTARRIERSTAASAPASSNG